MKLQYFTGKNFGDALNPYIFQHFLPDFFDDDDSVSFFGIGSILGFEMAQDAKRKIVFSSGFAYGEKPQIDDSYDIVCVRGPKTAEALGISSEYAIADGAILLQFMDIPKPKKCYKYSFIPHWGSEQKYSKWPELCAAAGIHYISPMADKDFVLQEILKTEIVIAEAMHGAIVADSLGVPWIPAKAYPTINEFKWNDWAQSLNMTFDFQTIPSMYEHNEFMQKKLRELSKNMIPAFLLKFPLTTLEQLYYKPKRKTVIGKLKGLKSSTPYLSDRSILRERGDALLQKLELIKEKYSVR